MIDHVLCTTASAALVTNVQTKPGFECDTDHRLVRATLQLPLPWRRGRSGAQPATREGRPPRLAVERLKDSAVREAFQAAFDATKQDYTPGAASSSAAPLAASGPETYADFAKQLRSATEEHVGTPDTVRRPAWQRANADALKECARQKRDAWKAAQQSGDFRGYCRLCKEGRKANRRMFNERWQAEAARVQEAVDKREPAPASAGQSSLGLCSRAWHRLRC